MTEVTLSSLEDLVKSIKDKRDEIDAQSDVVKKLNSELGELEQKCMGYLKEAGKDSYQSEYGTIYQIQKPRITTPKTDEDKKAFFAYLEEKGLFLQYASVNSNSLNSFYKAEFEAAKERGDMAFSIPGLGTPSIYESIGFRKRWKM